MICGNKNTKVFRFNIIETSKWKPICIGNSKWDTFLKMKTNDCRAQSRQDTFSGVVILWYSFDASLKEILLLPCTYVIVFLTIPSHQCCIVSVEVYQRIGKMLRFGFTSHVQMCLCFLGRFWYMYNVCKIPVSYCIINMPRWINVKLSFTKWFVLLLATKFKFVYSHEHNIWWSFVNV